MLDVLCLIVGCLYSKHLFTPLHSHNYVWHCVPLVIFGLQEHLLMVTATYFVKVVDCAVYMSCTCWVGTPSYRQTEISYVSLTEPVRCTIWTVVAGMSAIAQHVCV